MTIPDPEKIIEIIAAKNSVTVEEAKRQITEKARQGLSHHNEGIRYFWSLIPKKGKEPTAEEIIRHLSLIILRIHGVC